MKINSRHLLQIGLTTNIFEWYEFIVFAYLAEVMGRIFFSTEVPSLAIINTFAVIATSYLARPFGSWIFGYMSDKHSLEKVVKLSIMVMAIPTVIIGILPTYKQIGVLSPICLVLLRLIQGFAAGGEYPCSASYIYNKSISHRYSTILCCLPIIGSISGALLASFIIYLLYTFFDLNTIMDWAWRIPFLISIPLLIFIINIRRQIPHAHTNIQLTYNQLPYKKYLLEFTTAFIIAGFLEIVFYIVLVWMPTYLEFFLKIPHQVSRYTNILALVTALTNTLLFSYLAKHISYKILLRTGVIMITVFIYPMLTYMTSSLLGITILQLFLGFWIGCIQGVFLFAIMRLFPDHIRSRGIAITFTSAATFLGGTAPLICSYMIKQLHFINFPALYISVFGILTFIFTWSF